MERSDARLLDLAHALGFEDTKKIGDASTKTDKVILCKIHADLVATIQELLDLDIVAVDERDPETTIWPAYTTAWESSDWNGLLFPEEEDDEEQATDLGVLTRRRVMLFLIAFLTPMAVSFFKRTAADVVNQTRLRLWHMAATAAPHIVVPPTPTTQAQYLSRMAPRDDASLAGWAVCLVLLVVGGYGVLRWRWPVYSEHQQDRHAQAQAEAQAEAQVSAQAQALEQLVHRTDQRFTEHRHNAETY